MAWISSWTSGSAERISAIESWLWAAVLIFAILSAASGFVAAKLASYRGSLEKQAGEDELKKTREELTSTRNALNTRNAQLEHIVTESSLRTQELETKNAPRRLSAAQVNQLTKSLRQAGGVRRIRIASLVGDAEGMAYAQQLASVFRNSGRQVGIFVHERLGLDIKNITVIFHYVEDQSDHELAIEAMSVAQLLSQAGVRVNDVDVASGVKIDPGDLRTPEDAKPTPEIEIIVGRKRS